MDIENTFESIKDNLTERQKNSRFVERNSECQYAINELREIEEFLERFGYLTFGRDFVIGNPICFSPNSIVTSLQFTMGSVIACCEGACIADANTLLRKYRDDLFFYLYLAVYNSLDKDSNTAKSMETQITKWLSNDMNNFHISKVLKAIATAPQLQDAVLKYSLEKSFQEISDVLNNYVHSNGYSYYNRYVNAYRNNELITELRLVGKNARYMTVVFLLLLVFCSPLSVMAEDYIDFLEFNEVPPDGSQYWVAPFVENFVKNNISLIDANCIDYLRENTPMKF